MSRPNETDTRRPTRKTQAEYRKRLEARQDNLERRCQAVRRELRRAAAREDFR